MSNFFFCKKEWRHYSYWDVFKFSTEFLSTYSCFQTNSWFYWKKTWYYSYTLVGFASHSTNFSFRVLKVWTVIFTLIVRLKTVLSITLSSFQTKVFYILIYFSPHSTTGFLNAHTTLHCTWVSFLVGLQNVGCIISELLFSMNHVNMVTPSEFFDELLCL